MPSKDEQPTDQSQPISSLTESLIDDSKSAPAQRAKLVRSKSAVILRRPVPLLPPPTSNRYTIPVLEKTPKTSAYAPRDWFADIKFKEMLAVMAMEAIPHTYIIAGEDLTKTPLRRSVNPKQRTLLDRMKFLFSRVMARARFEAASDDAIWTTFNASNPRHKRKITLNDVMNRFEVEKFLAGIEEIYDPGKDGRLVFRRYWRLLVMPGMVDRRFGGVISAGSTKRYHVHGGVKQSVALLWDTIPKTLIAEIEVDDDRSFSRTRWFGEHEFEVLP